MSRLTKLWRQLVVPAAAVPAVVPVPPPAEPPQPVAIPQQAAPPRSVSPAEIVSMSVPPLHRKDFPVVVCWSAKAGCTTVLKWFLHHTGLLDAALAHNAWPHRYRMQVLMNPITDYVATCLEALRGGDPEVIKVVRDPARRAVSSYLHLLRVGNNPGWKHGVSEWKQGVGLGRQPGLTFEQFLHFVIDTQASGQPLDIHFQQQFLPKWDAFVDRFIPLERLADELPAVEDRHGLPRTDLRLFSESGHHTVQDHHHRWPGDVARFTATIDDLKRLGTPPAEDFLDNDGIADMVRLAYARDYEAYGDLYAEPRQAMHRRAA